MGATAAPAAHGPYRSVSLTLAALAVALGLAGCGGGGDAVATLDINAIVGGQPYGQPFVPGAPSTLAIHAGQSIELDASEPVEWVFTIGNSPVFTSGTTAVIGGISVTETALTPSRVAIDTGVVASVITPVTITLTATSTIDAAQVAVVNLLID
jgi:hypothetical protein